MAIETNLEGLSARIAKIAPDTNTLLQRASSLLEHSVEERIRSSKVDPDGKAWPSLAPSTARRKRGRGILEETGSLAASIRSIAHEDTAEVGSPLPYAAIVGEGFRTRSGGLAPARQFLGLSKEDEEGIEGLALLSLEEALA